MVYTPLPPKSIHRFRQTVRLDDLRLRPMRPSERSLVVACWWAMRGAGVKLPAEPGVIVIEGGAP